MLLNDAQARPERQQKSAGKTGAFDLVVTTSSSTVVTAMSSTGQIDRRDSSDYWTVLPPPCSAICELNGESPCLGSSTTTIVPIFTRLYRSITSSFVIRMQPEEIDAPIYSGWLVP